MKMQPAIQELVLHWGEMGAKWGISRTVARIHALLYFSPKPLAADEITELLGIARSHVSNSLKELQSWGVVKNVHILGDRREHFESIKDVWKLFEALLDERKKREVDPTLAALRSVEPAISSDPDIAPETRQRCAEMLEFFETMEKFYTQMRKMPIESRMKLVKLGSRLASLLK
jgi:DNA-binding transcriptional regulator GbsR (MarR family)